MWPVMTMRGSWSLAWSDIAMVSGGDLEYVCELRDYFVLKIWESFEGGGKNWMQMGKA